MQCLDRPSPGTHPTAIPGTASDSRRGGNAIAGRALGRHPRARIRPSSRPAALKRSALVGCPRPRPRTPTWLVGQRVPPAWCRPTSACSLTPFRRRDRGDFPWYHDVKALPIYWCGAADAPGVGRSRATHAMERQRPIQPRDCRSLIANACESGIRPPSRATHPLPGQASAGNARGRYPRPRIRPPSWWERNRGQRPRTVSQAAHPTAIAPSSAEKERARTLSQAAPSGANMAGRLARVSGAVPPNQRMQPDAAPRRARSRRF
jgi:hypothetical protein